MTSINYAIITLRSDAQRVRHVTESILPHLSAAPTVVEVVDAVERAALPPPEELQRAGVIHPNNDLLPHSAMRLGQVACALSHVGILKRHALKVADPDPNQKNPQWLVILEDDVELLSPADFTERVAQRLASLPPTADACYLHVYDGREDEVALQEEVAQGVRRAHKMLATWAIAYTPRGAAKLVANAIPMRRAVDNTLSELVDSGEMEMYTCFPALVRSTGDVGPFPEHRREMRSTIWLTQ